jgi:uncharacterized protein (TIGR04222 family)
MGLRGEIMGWLLDNALADMPGTSLLMFYGIAACIVLIGAYFFIDMQDMTDDMPPPATPSEMDPYELAYLRGGVNEAIRTAIYALRRQRLIEIDKGRIRPAGAGGQGLDEIDARVFDAIRSAPKIGQLFKNRDLRGEVESLSGGYRRRLSAQQLLAPPERRRAGYFALGVGAGLLLALAGYKFWAAMMHGRSNIGFLFMEAVASCVLLYWIFDKTTSGGASKRGKAFLSQVQLAYSGRVGAAFGGEAGRAAMGGSALFMVGLFGFGILKDTPDAALAQQFARASQSGSDGGGGCGGGDGGGGGCGGCGGGGD